MRTQVALKSASISHADELRLGSLRAIARSSPGERLAAQTRARCGHRVRRVRAGGLEALVSRRRHTSRYHRSRRVEDAVGQRAALVTGRDRPRGVAAATTPREERAPKDCSDATSGDSPRGDPAGPSRSGSSDRRSAICSRSHGLSSSLHDEQRAERQVDAGAVEMKRVARRFTSRPIGATRRQLELPAAAAAPSRRTTSRESAARRG